MGRFSDYLKELNPINGHWLAEDGEFVNVTDWLKTQRDYSPAWQTCQARAWRRTSHLGVGVQRGYNGAQH